MRYSWPTKSRAIGSSQLVRLKRLLEQLKLDTVEVEQEIGTGGG